MKVSEAKLIFLLNSVTKLEILLEIFKKFCEKPNKFSKISSYNLKFKRLDPEPLMTVDRSPCLEPKKTRNSKCQYLLFNHR